MLFGLFDKVIHYYEINVFTDCNEIGILYHDSKFNVFLFLKQIVRNSKRVNFRKWRSEGCTLTIITFNACEKIFHLISRLKNLQIRENCRGN